ncbi:MAG: CoA transferase [Dehalococcoidia bacterium]|nr:CoA transferase [Dehalococcoidia bacterium]
MFAAEVTVHALDDLTVIDLSTGIAGPYATRVLADCGADVIKVEPPGGDIARTWPPFAGDDPHPEKSGIFAYLNTNKRSVVLDLETAAAREQLAQLVRRADLVVESFGPGRAAELGVTWEWVRAINPRASLVSISDFGQSGPYRDYRLTELTLWGFAGSLYPMGIQEREPVKMAGTAALIECGVALVSGMLGAIFARDRIGHGQRVDASLSEMHFASGDRRQQSMITYQFTKTKTPLRGFLNARGMPSGIYPCADGYVEFTSASQRPERVAAMMDNPAWLADPDFNDPTKVADPEVVERWNSHFLPWCLERTKAEIWAAGIRAGVLCGPLFDAKDLHHDPVLRARGFWATVEHPVLGTFDIPGRQFMMEGGATIRRPAPLLGEHTAEVLAEAPASEPAPPPPAAPATGQLPLSGVRIVDLTVVIAGTYGTLLLGDLGAEVIKVENPFVMQPMTRSMRRRPSEDPVTLSAYPDGELGPRPWNYWATHVTMYRNKKSVTVDYRTPQGLDILKRLVAMADVVTENNAVELLPKLGITYEWLREANPNIIFVRLPAFALEGPYAKARALGWHVEAAGGHTVARGYEDHDPSANNIIFTGDWVAGMNLANATLVALRHRQRTRRGQMVEVSQMEGVVPLTAHHQLDYALNGCVPGAIGNRDIHERYPCGVYPAASPGTPADGGDHWVAIHVQTDEEWRALAAAMGSPEWADDPRFATNDGRRDHCQEIDARIAEWTRARDDYELFHLLQGHGVSAAPVLEASRMLDEPHLRARGFLRPQRIDNGKTYDFIGPLYDYSDTPLQFYQDPATLGEHNEYVYRELLQVSDEEWASLQAAGHIATEFDESIP